MTKLQSVFSWHAYHPAGDWKPRNYGYNLSFVVSEVKRTSSKPHNIIPVAAVLQPAATMHHSIRINIRFPIYARGRASGLHP
jgi:hypothetical protein